MSWQDIATQVTLCNFGTTGAAYAAAAAWGSAYTGQVWGTVGFGAVSAALAAASAANGCYSPPPTDPPTAGDYMFGCIKATAQRRIVSNSGAWSGYTAAEIVSVSKREQEDYWNVEVYERPNDLDTVTHWIHSNNSWSKPDFAWGLDPDGPGECERTADEPVMPDPPTPIPIPDPDTGCTWNVTMADSYLNQRGNLVVLYKATSNDPDTCGPDQYWWHETGKDPTPITPEPKPDPDPPIPPPEPLPCCDDIKTKLDEIKECACSSDEQPLEGDYRTITFISDENSPEGKSRLSKRFRYRSSSGVGLSGVVDHWRAFTWQAGAVCVSHKGSTLGAPQVWAATAEEGKRVIRHAAGEAGIDADQVGRWLVSGSVDPRYGMPGTMRVNTKGGYYWITSRLGPDQRPLVAES